MAKADALGDFMSEQMATWGRTATQIDVLPVCLTDEGLTNATVNMTAGLLCTPSFRSRKPTRAFVDREGY